MTNNLNVTLKNIGNFTLKPTDHIATGGEGSVYKVKDKAVKIYTDRQKVKWNDVVNKVDFFQTNKHKYIVAPEDVVLNRNDVVGYYMPFIKGESIAKVFTNAYRARSNFTDDKAHVLVERMREIVLFAHQHNALLIDANELGYFVVFDSNNNPEPRIIDVDSWIINNNWPPKIPMMASIRDWQIKGKRNNGTDWFSWGVVTFQILTGIHPYKGTLQGYKKSQLTERMQNNASVFSSGIRLNSAVRDFSLIPGPLLDWYINVFQHGKRDIPPSPFEKGLTKHILHRPDPKSITASGDLVYTEVYSGGIVEFFSCGAILTINGGVYDLQTKKLIDNPFSSNVKLFRWQDECIIASLKDNKLAVKVKNQIITLEVNSDTLIAKDNRLFVLTSKGLTEITLKELGSKILLSVGSVWGVLLNSTVWFDGVGFQDTMGSYYMVIPWGEKACSQIRVPELDNLKIIDAKSGNRFVVVMCVDVNGNYQKSEFYFDKDYASYRVDCYKTDTLDLNMAILDKGVCATVVDDRELVVFVPSNGNTKKVNDRDITMKTDLFSYSDNVYCYKDEKVFKITLK